MERRRGWGKLEPHTWDEGRQTTGGASSWRYDGEKEKKDRERERLMVQKNNQNFSNVHCVSMHKCALAMICEVGMCVCVCDPEPSASQPATYPAVYQCLSSPIKINILQTTNHTQTPTCMSILKDPYWHCASPKPLTLTLTIMATCITPTLVLTLTYT